MRSGRIVFADVVDHKFPIADGGAVHNPANWWGLCTLCHAWKLLLERYARREGLLHLIVQWCDQPETRPELRRGDLR